jgi:formylglycine-generating enzyme required for sulfatase activity
MDADEQQFIAMAPAFERHGERAWLLLIATIDSQLPPDAPDADKEALAKSQANAATVLLRMKQPQKVWPLLKHSPDPRLRSYLIHRLGPLGADFSIVADRLAHEPDISVRRALLQCLGEFDATGLAGDDFLALLSKLQVIYQTDPDPGLHAAAEWLLRQWKQEAWLRQINADWGEGKAVASGAWRVADQGALVPPSGAQPKSPGWFVNGQGQTLVVFPGPVEFLMGAAETDPLRQANEWQHRKRIGRTFAVASKPVTLEEFRRFRDPAWDDRFTPTRDCPVIGQTWFNAADYCNWLNQAEKIPEDQWCYEFTGQEWKLKADYLNLTGYRLPTEAEFEYATRAGAATCRFYGETEELLPKYGWYLKNSQQRTWPVGSLKPNDFGMFDVHGHAHTWCTQGYTHASPVIDEEGVSEDRDEEREAPATAVRTFRGGSFLQVGDDLRCAARGFIEPTTHMAIFGLRVARTLPPRGG